MDNPGLFSQPESEPLFDTPVTQSTEPTHTDQQNVTTAALASFAQRFHEGPDDFNTAVSINKDMIDQGKESVLRQALSDQSRNDRVSALRQAQIDKLQGKYSPATMADLVKAELTAYGIPDDYNALEKQGIDTLGDLAQSDPHQAAAVANTPPDLFQESQDNLKKIAIFNRYADGLKKEAENQGVLGSVVDFGLSLVPGLRTLTQTGLALNPAGSINQASGKLWDLPLPEFEKKVDELSKTSISWAGVFGLDKKAAADAFGRYYAGVRDGDYLSYNILAGIDIASVPGVAKIFTAPLALVQATGNRSVAATAAAGALIKDATRGSDVLGIGKVITPGDSIVEALPSIDKPSTANLVRPYVGIQSDIADNIENRTKAVQEALRNLPQIQTLSPEQVQEAVTRTLKEVSERFKDYGADIADVKEDLAPGNVRMYHGGADTRGTPDIPLWFTSHLPKAQGYASKSKEGKIFYVDLPEDHPLIKPEYPEQSAKNGFTFDRELPGGISNIRKELSFQVTKNPDTDKYAVNVYFGRGAGSGGYSSAEATIAAIERKGWAGEADLYQNVDKQWFIRKRVDVSNNGIVTPKLTEADIPKTGFIGRYLKSDRNVLPDTWYETKLQGTLTRGVLWDRIYKPLYSVINKLNRKSAAAVDNIAELGQAEKKWYNLEELEQKFQEVHKRLPTQKETEAYYAYKDINDADHHLVNHFTYKEKVSQGKETVQIGKELTRQEENTDRWEEEGGLIPGEQFRTGRTTGRIIENPDFDELRVLDQATGEAHTPGKNTPEFKRKYDTGQYHVVQLERPASFKGDPVKYVLVHKNSVKRSPLQYHQVGYIEGGNVENKDKYFVKQSVYGKFSDGRKYSLQPHTHISSPTHVQAVAWAEKMQAAVDAYMKRGVYKSEAERRAIVESAPWADGNYDKFESLVNSGKVRTDTPFEILFDKQLPKDMTPKDTAKWTDGNESARSQYLNGKGQMYYSHRGERLPDPEGQKSRIFSPFKTTQRAVNHAIRTAAFSEYNKMVIEDWNKAVSAVNGFRKPTTDNMENFFHGELSNSLDSTVRNKLEAVRGSHLRFLNSQNPIEAAKMVWARKFAEFADDYGPIGRSIATGTLDIADKNVLRSVQNFLTDSYLGVMNIGQFAIQASTGVAAMAVHPVYGLRAAAMLPAWTHVLLSRSEGVLDWYSKVTAVHGMKPEEWKTMVRTYMNEGWGNVGKSITYLDSMSSKLGGSMIGRGLSTAREVGRYPLYLAERFNRVIGFNIAWNRTRAELPGLALNDPKFLGTVRKYTDDYTLNMAGASRSAWQQGVLSIPFQFQQYQAHMIEAILPKALGGGKAFDGYKARLAATQLLMFGAGGYGTAQLGRWIGEQYYNATGTPMDQDTYTLATRGLVDSFINYASGGELQTDFSTRVGPLAGLAQYLTKVADGDQSSTLGVFLGPAGTFANTAVEAAWKIGTYFEAEQHGTISPEDWVLAENDILSLMKSGSNYVKGDWILRTGWMHTKSGDPIVPASRLEGYAQMLGIPLAGPTELFMDINQKKSMDDLVKWYGNMLAPIRDRGLDALSKGDDKTYKSYERTIQGITNLFRDNWPLQTQIIKELNKHSKYNNEQGLIDLQNQLLTNYGYKAPYSPRQQ